MNWVYKADQDPNLAETQPQGLKIFAESQLDFPSLFPSMPPLPFDAARFGNNLFFQQDDALPMDSDMTGYNGFEEDLDDYDEGEISDDHHDAAESSTKDVVTPSTTSSVTPSCSAKDSTREPATADTVRLAD